MEELEDPDDRHKAAWSRKCSCLLFACRGHKGLERLAAGRAVHESEECAVSLGKDQAAGAGTGAGIGIEIGHVLSVDQAHRMPPAHKAKPRKPLKSFKPRRPLCDLLGDLHEKTK